MWRTERYNKEVAKKYYVERITGFNETKRVYFVKWKGFKKSTEEPADDIEEQAPEHVQHFKEQQAVLQAKQLRLKESAAVRLSKPAPNNNIDQQKRHGELLEAFKRTLQKGQSVKQTDYQRLWDQAGNEVNLALKPRARR